MNTTRLRQVRRLFNNPDVPEQHNRAYQRKWVRSVRILGDNWLLAQPVCKVGVSKSTNNTVSNSFNKGLNHGDTNRILQQAE